MKFIKALACAAFVVAAPASAANILTNPGLESGSLTPWFQDRDFSSGVNWFVTSSDAHSGTFSAEDTGNKEIRQNFAGVAGSSIDQISFWARHPNVGTNTAMFVDLFYSDATDTGFLIDLVGTDWNFFDVTTRLDTTKTLVGFSLFGNSDGNPPVTRVDDFLINVGGGVPEPGTWAMMLLGFGAIGVMMRRRRNAEALA
jgi:hypothetical protein